MPRTLTDSTTRRKSGRQTTDTEGPAIRALAEYQSFWEAHTQTHLPEEDADGHVHP